MAQEHYQQMNEVDWGTPSIIVEAARRYLGGIDLDPASSLERNRIVRADRVLGLADVDPEVGIPCGWGTAKKIFINPPGGKFGKITLASIFWRALAAQREEDKSTSFIWVAYNINQLQTLQQVDPYLLGRCDLCVPDLRLAYLDKQCNPVNGTPSASAILGYCAADYDSAAFQSAFEKIGKVWRA